MSNNTDGVFSWEEAEKRIPGGMEMVKEMAQMLLTECPKLLEQIRNGLAAGDVKQVKIGAHTLKGSADVFAAKRVVEAAKKLEMMGRNEDLTGGDEALAALEKEVETLTLAIQAETG